MHHWRGHVVAVNELSRRRVVVDALPLGNLQPGCQLLLPLRSSVLKPSFDLDLSEIETFRQLQSLADAQIFVLLELALQLFELSLRVCLSRLPVNSCLLQSQPSHHDSLGWKQANVIQRNWKNFSVCTNSTNSEWFEYKLLNFCLLLELTRSLTTL